MTRRGALGGFLRPLTFSERLFLMPCLAAVGFIAVLVVTHLAMSQYAQMTVRIEKSYAPALALGQDLESMLGLAQRSLQDSVAASDASMLAETDALRSSFLARVEGAKGNSVLETSELVGIADRFSAYYTLARATAARMIRGETGTDLASDLERMRVDYNRLRSDLHTFTQRQTQAVERAFDAARATQRWSMSFITTVTVLCIVLLGAISLVTIRSLTIQLNEALRVSESMALDAPTAEIEVTSRDEMGTLLSSMREMVHRVREREEALRVSEERYALAARGANDGLWDWDLTTQRIYFSPRWKSMLGYEESELGNTAEAWLDRIHAEDRPAVRAKLEEHLGGQSQHFESEHRIQGKDGSYRWVLSRGLAVRGAEGKAYRLAGSQSDITERKRAEEQLLRDAFYDPLTGLPNRVLFMDRLRTALRVRRVHERLLAVVFLDVDRFKFVNDSLGHLAGDELLKSVARRLQSCLRPGDTVARFGGDEFTLLLDNLSNVGHATRVADRIRVALSRPFHLEGQDIFASASMGIALSSAVNEAEDLVRDADNAMYRAKATGRARYELFDAEMHKRAVLLLRLESELRRAIERQEFRVYYQPIVSLASGRLASFEALIRWQHPERGVVEPAEFIPLAEETGLIIPIGEWVLQEVCRQMRVWGATPGMGPIAVSANLSTRQFAQPDLVSRVRDAMGEAGPQAGHLRLEVTESAVMENATAAARLLTDLKGLGIELSIDDFGTGHSSLSALHELPIDTLKIDRSFIGRMDSGASDAEIVRTIVALAHNLKMNVVAEGVETAQQATRLRDLGCEFGQGYYFSRPLPEGAVKDVFASPVWPA
jgi:diguanylate cyclase (GGDEF)-like protein/PAS domain S-box-containing protein